VEFDKGQPLGRQIDRKLTMLDAYFFWRREIRPAPKGLNLSLCWVSRFTHGCVGAR
jgi:hypothetical protein